MFSPFLSIRPDAVLFCFALAKPSLPAPPLLLCFVFCIIVLSCVFPPHLLPPFRPLFLPSPASSSLPPSPPSLRCAVTPPIHFCFRFFAVRTVRSRDEREKKDKGARVESKTSKTLQQAPRATKHFQQNRRSNHARQEPQTHPKSSQRAPIGPIAPLSPTLPCSFPSFCISPLLLVPSCSFLSQAARCVGSVFVRAPPSLHPLPRRAAPGLHPPTGRSAADFRARGAP